MKILILFFYCVLLFAQDSTSEDSKYNLAFDEIKDVTRDAIPLPVTLSELKMNRYWDRDSKIEQNILPNTASMISFKQKNTNFIDSDLFLIVVGSAVVFGATAAYFKLESDTAYDKYLLTNDKSYKNKTDRYDLYSGLALGAMELNFGFLIYKFLTD